MTFFIFAEILLVGCVHSQYVDKMTPTYGPVAGNTQVVIRGGNLTNVTDVIMTNDVNVSFTLTFVSDDELICLSPGVPEESSNFSSPLTLLFESGDDVNTTEIFTFRPNPVIHGIWPAKSTVDGGIYQTIVGQHLDSVYEPRLRMTLVQSLYSLADPIYEQCPDDTCYSEDEDPSTERCQLINSERMICRSKPFYDHPPGLPGWHPNTGYNSDDYQIYIGFWLDGVTEYHNFTIIYIFPDPEVDGFKGGKDTMHFKVYKDQTTIDIWGDHMNLGAEPEDYHITIGEDGTCRIEDDSLITNVLTCSPPLTKPNVSDMYKNPHVVVRVGRSPPLFAGYVIYEVKPWDDRQVRIAVITTVCVVVLIVVIAVTATQVKKKRHESQPEGRRYVAPPASLKIPPNVPNDLRTALKSCLIEDPGRFTVGRQLGEGQFGSVHQGQFMDENGTLVPCAAKTIKESGVSRQEYRDFLEEATLMKDFNHENVLNLLGVVFKNRRPFVLLPYMANGDLRTYLRNESKSFTVAELLLFGQQAAQGMAYLEASRCVHRDLAARNCMVSDEDLVKVADFGLARDIFQEEYYRVQDTSRPLPIKWMAPECLDDHKFSSKSDVWSFGVLLWEVMTRGKRPYAQLDVRGLKSHITRGNRLEKPEYLPYPIYSIMLQCWDIDPHKRPSFNEIVEMIEKILRAEDEDDPAAVEDVNIFHGADALEELAQGRGYQNLSRYVDCEPQLHQYQPMSQLVRDDENPSPSRYQNIVGAAGNGSTDRPHSGYLSPAESSTNNVVFDNAAYVGDEN